MPLAQLQGLTPLGGSSGYGTGQPPNADGTDPNDPNKPKPQPHSQAPSSGPSSSQGPSQTPTFAQLQAQGRARPAPPPQPTQGLPQGPSGAGGVNNQLAQSVSQSLANPSAYGAPQVQQSFDALNSDLNQQYAYEQKQLNDQLASRGLSESTIAGQQYSDLATEQSRAQAQLAAQLATQAATTYGQDRTSALNSALGYTGQQLTGALGYGNLGVAQQQANTQQTGTLGQLGLGQGQLGLAQLQNQQQYGLQQGELTGSYGGQSTLGAQSLALQQALGYGNLGVAQQQANTGAQSVANQYTLGQGQLGLGQQQLAQQGSQFGQNLAFQQLQNSQQYGLNKQQLAAQEAYQSGQLGLGQSQINASLLNEQRQAMGNLAYAGLLNGKPPSQDWINFLMSNQGQNTNSLYNLPSWAGQNGPGSYGSAPGSQGNAPQPNSDSGLAGTMGAGGSAGGSPNQGTNGQGNLPPGISAQLAAIMGYTNANGGVPLIGNQYLKPGQTQQQAASNYQQLALNNFQQQFANGTIPLNTPGLSDQQYGQLLNTRYQSLLNANNGWQQGAIQALLNGSRGDVNPNDPRVQQFLQTLGGTQ